MYDIDKASLLFLHHKSRKLLMQNQEDQSRIDFVIGSSKIVFS